MRNIIVIIVLVLFVAAGFFIWKDSGGESSTERTYRQYTEAEYTHEGDLIGNGSSGEEKGVYTGDAYGVVQSRFQRGTYQLSAVVDDLLGPPENTYYEAWLVRRGADEDIRSIGRLEKFNLELGPFEEIERYVLFYRSEEDLTEHTFFVVTVENDNGNPEFSGRVAIEGELSPL